MTSTNIANTAKYLYKHPEVLDEALIDTWNKFKKADTAGKVGMVGHELGAFFGGGAIGKGVGTVVKIASRSGMGFRLFDKAEVIVPNKAAASSTMHELTSEMPHYDLPFNISGSAGAAKIWSTKARLNAAELPTSGKIRFIQRKNYQPSQPLRKGPQGGFIDRFGNEWVKGPSRTPGQSFEWDVQLSKTGQLKLGWASRDGIHLNISLDGRITHR